MPGGAGEVPVQACLGRFRSGTGRLEQVQAVRTSSCGKAGRDARWIWPTGAYGPCSCPAQRGRRAATATPAVTAWKWLACLRGGWRCVTRSVPVTRSWSSPGPSGRRFSAPSERRPPADRRSVPGSAPTRTAVPAPARPGSGAHLNGLRTGCEPALSAGSARHCLIATCDITDSVSANGMNRPPGRAKL